MAMTMARRMTAAVLLGAAAVASAEQDGDIAAATEFCTGDGSVMFNGFTSSIHGGCVRLFFRGWVLRSAGTYVVGAIGCALLAVANEAVTKMHRRLQRKQSHHGIQAKLMLTAMYALQMTTAYLCMLVAMTYEIGLFIALLLGFAVGYVCYHDFDQDATATDIATTTALTKDGSWRDVDPSVVRLQVHGMKCAHTCKAAIERVLLGTDGVQRVFVDFDRKCVYVAGLAPVSTLQQAIESIGFAVQVDNTGSYVAPSV